MKLGADWWLGHPSWRQWLLWKAWVILADLTDALGRRVQR